MRNKFLLPLLGFCGLLSLNCATTSAPAGWLPDKTKSEKDAFGGWATLETKHREIVRGELIAVNDSGIYVLPDNDLLFVEIDSVQTIKIGKYEDGNTIAGWAAFGTFSTLSHGFVLLISAPVWILSGTLISADYASQKVMFYPDSSLESLRVYSRFPQGLSESINRKEIKPKFFSADSGRIPNNLTGIQQNTLSNPLELKLGGSIMLSSENEFTESMISIKLNVKNLFHFGVGISRNKYETAEDISYSSAISFNDKKYNYSPFFEIGKSFRLGTVNPYISASIYANTFDHGFTNGKEMYSLSLGANTLLGTTSFAVQTEIKYVYISERPPFMPTQNYRPILLNIGMVYYF